MKTLFVLRHAKSSWDHPNLRDHDRPLARRGQNAAPRMGRYMRRQDFVPELVLCSTSTRTRETWELLEGELRSDVEPLFTEELYHASAGSLLMLASRLPDTVASAMLIGHNPGMHAASEMLAGSGDEGLLDELSYKFPTGALAVLSFDAGEWSGVRATRGHLVDFVRPRNLG